MLRTTPFHIVYATGEEHEPIEFFFDALMESKSFDLGLGFFSSSAISALSAGFAYFIHRGGKMRIIINDVLSQKDKDTIEQALNAEIDFEEVILQDIKQLFKTLSKQDEHFFKCLSYLISKDRIEFLATKPKNGKSGIAHNKYGIFKDEDGNKVAFNGSANFSKNALINNVESISCYKSWSTNEEKERLDYFEKLFNKTWNRKAKNIEIIPINKVKTYIHTSYNVEDIEELLKEEVELTTKDIKLPKRIREKVEKILSTKKKQPQFPFPSGPREYQKKAYENWVANNYQGIFAMATGTGKTITSLNCVLNEYKKTGKYNVLILVPTITLVDQWKYEIKKFHFKNIIEVTGRVKWREKLIKIKNDFKWDIHHDFFIVSTYVSFTDYLFQKILKTFGDKLILIADEAHNIGAQTVKNAFQSNNTFHKRIALSATPKRAYDPVGTLVIEKLFNDNEPYCYSYSLKDAIKNEFLTNYFYYPRIVKLTDDEFSKYINISKRLLQFYNSKTKEFKNSAEVERLLLLRKQIIHKAKNKIDVFKNIVNEIKINLGLRYCFVYVPEGYGYKENGNKFSYIEELVKALYEVNPEIKSNTYLGKDNNKEDILKGFSEGKIDVLFAMKCLDEGVDIPRAQIGIFASSTGNPRQFIQRRGRLLRKHSDKDFAYIYDMIVTPMINFFDKENYFNMERNLVKNELTRVAYFASLSNNFYYSKEILYSVSNFYNLDIDQIINDL